MNLRTATTNPTLYIVATPIGNRNDITLRAIEILKNVDFILAEDTRHSKPFLDYLGIKKPLISFHEHNEKFKTDDIINRILHGESAALISDAGTPLISDPGYLLVSLARKHGIDVSPIPGSSALIAALSAAGVACETFTFVGFLPNKQNARRLKLEEAKQIQHTVVFYESSHRIINCMRDLEEIFGSSCKIVMAKEITKTFEKFLFAQIKDIIDWLEEDQNHSKGEFVIIIPAKEDKEKNKENIEIERILQILLKELPVKQAVKIASSITESNKNDIYKMAVSLKNS